MEILTLLMATKEWKLDLGYHIYIYMECQPDQEGHGKHP